MNYDQVAAIVYSSGTKPWKPPMNVKQCGSTEQPLFFQHTWHTLLTGTKKHGAFPKEKNEIRTEVFLFILIDFK